MSLLCQCSWVGGRVTTKLLLFLATGGKAKAGSQRSKQGLASIFPNLLLRRKVSMGQLALGRTQALGSPSIAPLHNKSPRKSCRSKTKVFDAMERSTMEVISEWSSLTFFAFSASAEGLVKIPILVITHLQTLRIWAWQAAIVTLLAKVVVIYQYIEINEMPMIKLVLIIKHVFSIGIKIFPFFSTNCGLFYAHPSRPWSIGWVAVSFLVCFFVPLW